MSKKHFIMLADYIRDFNRTAKIHGCEPLAEEHIAMLAQFCQHMNPNFKGDRWRDYIAGLCGKNGGRIANT